MKKILVWTTCICLSCLFAGCAVHSAAEETPADPAIFSGAVPAVPPGMRLGASYISALNETCYELLSADGFPNPCQTLCLRGRNWEIVPPVLTVLPGKIPAAEQ